MSLSPYLSQAQYFADELLSLLTDDEIDLAGHLLDRDGPALVLQIPQADLKPLYVFLGKTPAEHEKQFSKLRGEDRLRFWLRARHMALSAVDALTIAYHVDIAMRRKHRDAYRAIAEAFHRHQPMRSKDDILTLRIR